MSKIIKITPQHIEECKAEFEEALSKSKLADGKISFTKTFTSPNRKATVYFTPLAWLKMNMLIKEFDKEVAWHGIAYRSNDETKDEYFITDILVYPQEVTGATVNTDQEKYQMWLMEHDDDTFNNIRMQGHSHVNMGVTPSSVDLTHQEKILEQLDDTMFYIFMIWNKSGACNTKIYDLQKNILFETADVSITVSDSENTLSEFMKLAKDMVKNKQYTYNTPSTYKNTTTYPTPTKGVQQVNTTQKKTNDSKYTDIKSNAKNNKKSKRKGKRRSQKQSSITNNPPLFRGSEDNGYDGAYGYYYDEYAY